MLINAPFTTVEEAARLGVRRISVGGTLARTAWDGFLRAAREFAEAGTFSRFEDLPNVDALSAADDPEARCLAWWSPNGSGYYVVPNGCGGIACRSLGYGDPGTV